MRKYIYLIRHAEAQSNVDSLFKGENNLTSLGHEQSLQLSEALQKISFEKIYSSPSLRAQQTADEVCKTKELKKEILDLIDERKVSYVNDGEYENEECFKEFIERVKETKILFENQKEKSVAVFCHAIFIKGLILYILLEGSLTDDLFNTISKKIAIDYATISKIVYNQEKNKWHISFLNSETPRK